MSSNSQDITINDYKFQVIIDSDEPENRELKIKIKLSEFEEFWKKFQDLPKDIDTSRKLYDLLNKFVHSSYMKTFIKAEYLNIKYLLMDCLNLYLNDPYYKIKKYNIYEITIYNNPKNIYIDAWCDDFDYFNKYVRFRFFSNRLDLQLINEYGEMYVSVSLDKKNLNKKYLPLIDSVKITDQLKLVHLKFGKYLLIKDHAPRYYYPEPKSYSLILSCNYEKINKFRLENMNNFFKGRYQEIFNSYFDIIGSILKSNVIENAYKYISGLPDGINDRFKDRSHLLKIFEKDDTFKPYKLEIKRDHPTVILNINDFKVELHPWIYNQESLEMYFNIKPIKGFDFSIHFGYNGKISVCLEFKPYQLIIPEFLDSLPIIEDYKYGMNIDDEE